MERPTRLACYAAILALIALTQRPDPALQSSAPEPPKHPLPFVPPAFDNLQTTLQLPSTVRVKAAPAQSPPSGHQFTAIEAKLRRDRDILTTERLADGTVAIHLNGGFQNASFARRKPDGSLETVCFNDFDQAREFLLQPSMTTPPGKSIRTSPPLVEK